MAKATALVAAALLCIGTSAPAQAETDDWLRESVFRVLKRSSELKRDGDYDRALAMLRTALDGYVDVGDGVRARAGALRPYEAALLTESLAATFNLVGDYENAKKHWRMVVDKPIGLDAEGLNRAWHQLTVSHHLLDDHAGVVRIVAQWREHVAKPSPNAAKMAAFAHRSLDNRETALEEAERHVALLREAGEPIPSRMTRFIESLRRPKGEMSDLLTSELSGLVSADTRQLLVRTNDMIGRMRYKQAVDLLADAIAASDLPATDVAALREKLAFALSYRRDTEGAREQFKAITQTPGDLPDEALDKVWMRPRGGELPNSGIPRGAVERRHMEGAHGQARRALLPARRDVPLATRRSRVGARPRQTLHRTGTFRRQGDFRFLQGIARRSACGGTGRADSSDDGGAGASPCD